ncbi:hypothetical protein GCM10010264_06790 [Streptomyces globisporus]|uniref:hypothetical protein n=1 Tax=Streptomyces globisporus TaxID=1908 RepID=UPI00178550B9|nr:hypothetical protein GCM10010264_06790 [Streptomyces globisporus]
MVAIIRCTEQETDHVEFKEKMYPAARRERWSWTITRPREFWPKGSHVTLIATPDANQQPWVTRLGMTKRVRQVSDLQQKLEISQTTLIDRPVPLDTVLNCLHDRHRRHVVAEGQQKEATGKAVLAALIELRPELRNTLLYISATVDGYRMPADSKAGQALATQRDATLAVARMAGMSIPQLAQWDPPAEQLYDDRPPPAYLDLLSRTAPSAPSSRTRESSPAEENALEDHLINRDTENLLGWFGSQTAHVAWRQFKQHGQTLFVANANRSSAERISGADIIYYNDTRQNLVLVQYKKLNARRGGYYYPDSDRNLNRELVRLRAMDRYAAHFRRSEDDHRLSPDPSWIKLCPPDTVIPQADVMVPGMYFSRTHFERLRQDPRLHTGRKKAVRFGYANVPSYLDNTMFTRLVETGMIGTTGVGTDLVRRQITRSYKLGHMVIMGVVSGEDAPQSDRYTRRRQGR